MSEIKCKITVIRPVLTEQERERRMKEVRKAVADIGRYLAVKEQGKEFENGANGFHDWRN